MAAVLIVLLAALVAWVVTLGGGGGGKKQDANAGGPSPAKSITPGPSGSGPAISQEPGGRDESDGGAGGADDGGKNGDQAGSGGGEGAGGSAGSGGSAGKAGSTGGTGTGSGSESGSAGGSGAAGVGGGAGAAGVAVARQVDSHSSLPTCGPGALRVTFSSTKVAYAPDEKPQFKLMVTNSSGTTCKVNLGPKTVVLTITNTEDDRIWTSKDCPKTTDMYFEVPAHSTVTHTETWNRRHSTTKCAGPTPPAAGAGTYLAQLTSSVATVPQAQSEKSIRLDQD